MDIRKKLLELLVDRSLKLGDFTLASGARSDYYIDARRTTMTAQGQFLVGRAGFDLIVGSGMLPTHVGGLTLGADPVSYAIAHASWAGGHPFDAFTVRKRAKEHGTGQRIEGGLPTNARVLIIEDAMTTGGSALQAVEVVRRHGADVIGALTLVDREAGARERLDAEGLELIALYTASELLAEKEEQERIAEEAAQAD